MTRFAFILPLLGLLAASDAALAAPRCGSENPDDSISGCTADILRHRAQRDSAPGLLAADYENRAIGYERKNMMAEALADYDRAVELLPDFVTYYNRGHFHNAFGDDRRAVDDLGEAIRRYDQMPRNTRKRWDENYIKALFQRGESLRRTGRDAEAAEDYGKAITLKPDDDDMLFNRALALAHSGQYDAAIADLTKVLALRRRQGNDVGALSNRAMAYLRKGDFPKAIADMDEVIRREGNSPSAFARRAMVWERAGQRDKAVNDYRQALQLYANLTEAREGLKRLGAE